MNEQLRGFFDYWFGDIVYLKTDPDQRQRMITAINMRGNNVTFELTMGTQTSWHYAYEMTTEVDFMLKTND